MSVSGINGFTLKTSNEMNNYSSNLSSTTKQVTNTYDLNKIPQGVTKDNKVEEFSFENKNSQSSNMLNFVIEPIKKYNEKLSENIQNLSEEEQKQILEKRLQELYVERDKNNGFFHPIIENGMQEEIELLEKELGVPHKADKWEKTWKTGKYAVNSFVEGAVSVGENVRDFVELHGTDLMVKAMMKVGYIDQEIYDEMMEETKANIAINYVKDSADIINEEQGLTGNVYHEETVRGIGNGMGRTAEIVGLSLAGGHIASTLGASTGATGAATTAANSSKIASVGTKIANAMTKSETYAKITRLGLAGLSGSGEELQTAFQNGATIDQAKKASYIKGAWDIFQWGIGEKIGYLNPFKKQLANSALHVGLDAIDGAAEGFVQPAIQNIYMDGTYGEIFNANGGWANVGTQALIGGIMSSASEFSGYAGNAVGKKISSDVKQDNVIAIEDYKNSKLHEQTSEKIVSMEEYKTQKEIKDIPSTATEGKEATIIDFPKRNTHETEMKAVVNGDSFLEVTPNNNDRIVLNGQKTNDNIISMSYNQIASTLSGYNLVTKLRQIGYDDTTISAMFNSMSENDINRLIGSVNTKTSSVVRFQNVEDISKFFGDPKQYILHKVRNNLTNKFSTNPEFVNKLLKWEQISNNTKVNNISDIDLVRDFYEYLDDADKKIVDDMYDDRSCLYNNITQEQKEVIAAFTRVAGPPIEAYLRKTKTTFGDKANLVTVDGTNIKYVKSSIKKGISDLGLSLDEKYIDPDYFISQLDGIIAKAPVLKQELVVYRSVNDLFLDNNKLCTFNIGQRFNDKGYTSSSAIPTVISDRSDIMLEIKLPKGTPAAYIESFAGVTNFGQQEILLPRNAIFEIKDTHQITNEGKLKIKVELIGFQNN